MFILSDFDEEENKSKYCDVFLREQVGKCSFRGRNFRKRLS